MIVAIYAPKSAEQERGESGDSLNVEEQIAGAIGFIATTDAGATDAPPDGIRPATYTVGA